MAMHTRMSYSLIILLLLASYLPCTNDEVQVIRQQRKEMDQYLQKLNKPAVKSIQSPDGDIIDCVNISHQPAFDHPLLKNHSIQMRPSFYPFGLDDKNEVASKKKINSIDQPWQQIGRCPEDTIPIRRIKRDDLLRASSIERFGKKSHGTVPNSMVEYSDSRYANHEYAFAGVWKNKYYGTQVNMNVWRPMVEQVSEFSLSQLWIVSGEGDDTNTIEAGWQADNYRNKGCYNLFCPGFVQTNNDVSLGAQLYPISSYGGTQYEITLNIWQDPTSRNWWFQFQNYDPLGYWPSSLFNSFADGASTIYWGGEIVNNAISDRHTSTGMGSGHFPEEAGGKASFFRKIQILDESRNHQEREGIRTSAEKSNCYNILLGNDPGGEAGTYFYYGGPGRNPNCP